MEMNKELLAKAKSAKSAAELTEIAKENGIELTEESAKAYFEQLHPKAGEITDEELENVSGGGCGGSGGGTAFDGPAPKYSIGEGVWYYYGVEYDGDDPKPVVYYGKVIKQTYENGAWYYTVHTDYMTPWKKLATVDHYIREDSIRNL